MTRQSSEKVCAVPPRRPRRRVEGHGWGSRHRVRPRSSSWGHLVHRREHRRRGCGARACCRVDQSLEALTAGACSAPRDGRGRRDRGAGGAWRGCGDGLIVSTGDMVGRWSMRTDGWRAPFGMIGKREMAPIKLPPPVEEVKVADLEVGASSSPDVSGHLVGRPFSHSRGTGWLATKRPCGSTAERTAFSCVQTCGR